MNKTTGDEIVRAWHFVGDTLRDGRPVPADGVWLHHEGSVPLLCNWGLHASRDPFDALQYAPGATLCLVDCARVAAEQHDKLVCWSRRIVARMDATEMLRYFARTQALSVVHLCGDTPDVVLDYLMTGDEAIRVAARDAAWDAAQDAAWSAAQDAAWNAARDAAWNAARDAAWNAARANFNALVHECFEGAL